MGKGSLMCRYARLTFVVIVASFAAGCGGGLSESSCSTPGVECTLAQAADEAGMWFGAAIESPSQFGVEQTVPSDFNSVTAENAMKWGELARTVGNYDFTRADAIAQFAEAKGVRLRGHTLVWRDQLPVDLRDKVLNAVDPARKLDEFLDDHIATVAGHFAGQAEVWDVVNEPLSAVGASLDRSLFYRFLGEQFIDDSFRRARIADPEAKLYLNEFFYSYALTDDRVQSFLALLARLRDREVPIDGVGVQAHFNGITPLTTRSEFQKFLTAIANLGLSIEITELDVSESYFRSGTNATAAQAALYRAVVGACAGVPACRGITVWGIHDGDTWLDTTPLFAPNAPHRPLLFDSLLTRKTAYYESLSALAERNNQIGIR